MTQDLTPEQRAEVLEAMERANYAFVSGRKNLHETLLDAALPVIRRAVLEECMNEAAAIAYQQDADHGHANTCGADAVLARLQALAGEVAT